MHRVCSVPALCTSKRSPAIARRSPSAIWLRAELCVHRNRTRDLLMLSSTPFTDSAEQALDDDAIAPLAVELAVPFVDADLTEAAALV